MARSPGAWWRFWRSKDEAQYRLRNAGPARGFETSVKALVAVPNSMSTDDLLKRIARLNEVIPQYQARPARLRAKVARIHAAALAGTNGVRAREAAEWLLADIETRAGEKLAELEARRAMYQAALDARLAALKGA